MKDKSANQDEAAAICRATDSATEGLVIRQQIRQRAQTAREARRVALTRGYRKGELPDIEQLTISDFAEPLRALRCVTASWPADVLHSCLHHNTLLACRPAEPLALRIVA